MPVHWGTFNLAFHSWTATPSRIVEAAKGQPVTLVIPVPGQMFEPVDPPGVDFWWERVDGEDVNCQEPTVGGRSAQGS